MHPVRPDELLIRCCAGRTGTSRLPPITFHMWHIRGLQFGDGRPLIVDHEPDVVDAAEIRRLLGSERGRVGASMLQDGEIDVAVAEPDAVLAGVPWPAVQFLQ